MRNVYYVSIPNREKYLNDMHDTIFEIEGVLIDKFGGKRGDLDIHTNCGLNTGMTPMEHIMTSVKYIQTSAATVFLPDSLQDESCELDRAIANYLGATVILL